MVLAGADPAPAAAPGHRLRARHDRPDAACASAPRSRSASTCPRSVAARSAGVRATPSPIRARISPRSRPRPSATATIFVVTGTKVWTSYADKSDWIFALVRSDPNAKKQEGITFLLIDMASPGVSVRPILLISGASPFCETRFDHVRVPIKNAVHHINAGWTVAKALLGHERNMIADVFGVAERKKGARGSSLAGLARGYLGARGRARCPTRRCATRSRRASSTSAPSASPSSARAMPPRRATSPVPRARSSRSTRPSSTSAGRS